MPVSFLVSSAAECFSLRFGMALIPAGRSRVQHTEHVGVRPQLGLARPNRMPLFGGITERSEIDGN